MEEYVISGIVNVRLLRNYTKQLRLLLVDWELDEFHNAKVCLIDEGGSYYEELPHTYYKEEQQLVIEQTVMPQVEQHPDIKWKLCLSYEQDGVTHYRRFVSRAVMKRLKEETEGKRRLQPYRFGPPLYFFMRDDICYAGRIYVTLKGRLGLMVKKKQELLLQVLDMRVDRVDIKGNCLTVTVSIKEDKYIPEQMALRFRTKKMDKKCIYNFTCDSPEKVNGRYVLEGRLDVSELELRPVYWDLEAYVYSKEEEEEQPKQHFLYRVQPRNHKQSFKDTFLRLRKEIAYRKNGYIFFPFVTKKDSLAFKYREINEGDSFWFRLKERIARKIYQSNKEYWDNKKICLIYEKYCMAAQDNGYYFFRYCVKHPRKMKQDVQFYYMIDKHSPDYKKVRKYGHRVVPFLSLKHMVYIQAAKVLISTDSKAHAYVWRQKGSILYDVIQEKKNVFLQHGVIGFKNITRMYGKQSSSGCNLFIASSEKEKEIIHKELGYPEKAIKVTGLARWDVLKNVPSERKEILIMPTWRSWLDSVSDEEFCKSSYFKHYEGLLTDEDLLRFIEQEDIYITFYLHPIMEEFIDDFRVCGDRISLISFGEQPLNEIIMRSKLMITDYSSAAWDMFYLKKPVIFYQFDAKDYEAIHGSYLDFETELFGRRAQTIQELVFRIKQVVEQNYEIEEEYLEKWDSAFAYVDDKNSERIMKAVAEYYNTLSKK